MKKCSTCKSDISHRHSNSKRCEVCAKERRKNPYHTLSKDKQEKALMLAGKKTRSQIAEMLQITRTSLNRFYKEKKTSSNSLKYDPKLVEKVCKYYEKKGKVETKKKFPDVVLRSVIERYYKKYNLTPRQKKWTSQEHVEVMKMAGLVSHEKQARLLNRVNANAGSIRSFHSKKVFGKARYLNGIPLTLAKGYVKEGCEAYLVSGCYGSASCEYKVLWVDVFKYLNDDVPQYLREAIKSIAEYQKKLYGKNYRKEIERYINL